MPWMRLQYTIWAYFRYRSMSLSGSEQWYWLRGKHKLDKTCLFVAELIINLPVQLVVIVMKLQLIAACLSNTITLWIQPRLNGNKATLCLIGKVHKLHNQIKHKAVLSIGPLTCGHKAGATVKQWKHMVMAKHRSTPLVHIIGCLMCKWIAVIASMVGLS